MGLTVDPLELWCLEPGQLVVARIRTDDGADPPDDVVRGYLLSLQSYVPKGVRVAVIPPSVELTRHRLQVGDTLVCDLAKDHTDAELEQIRGVFLATMPPGVGLLVSTPSRRYRVTKAAEPAPSP